MLVVNGIRSLVGFSKLDSVGIEHIDDIIEDLDQAIGAATGVRSNGAKAAQTTAAGAA